MAVSITGYAQTKLVVISLGGYEAPTSKRVFITNELFNGNLGGATGADDICQDEADNLPGSRVKGKVFKAWVSGDLATDFTENERSFHLSALPYRRTDGVLIAQDHLSLVTEGLLIPIERNAAGREPDWTNEHQYDRVWTGLSNAGAYEVDDCNGWTDGTNSYTGVYGFSDAFEEDWSSVRRPDENLNCDDLFRLYCFEQ